MLKKFLSIIISLSLVSISMPGYTGGSFLAPPGNSELVQSLINDDQAFLSELEIEKLLDKARRQIEEGGISIQTIDSAIKSPLNMPDIQKINGEFKVVIVGSGAIGCLFAGYLTLAGCVVELLGRNRECIEKLNQDGLTLFVGEKKFNVKVKATVEAKELSTPDVILIAVKSNDTKKAIEEIKQLAQDSTAVILTLQNGLNNVQKISEVIGKRKVIAGTTSEGATVLSLGYVRHNGRAQTVIGELDGKERKRIRRIAQIFKCAGFKIEITKNIYAAIYKKAIINAGINALTAILRIRNGELLKFKEARLVLIQAVKEAFRVTKAEGINLGNFTEQDAVNLTLEVAQKTSTNISSMLQDVLNGRPTEIRSINRAFISMAENLGQKVPANRVLSKKIEEIEQTRTSPELTRPDLNKDKKVNENTVTVKAVQINKRQQLASYANMEDFANRNLVGPLPDGKGSYKTVREVIEREMPACQYSFDKITEIRACMDRSGASERPLIIWQNMRLGEMYPYITENIKKEMGIVEIPSWEFREILLKRKSIPNNIKKAGYILIKEKLSSERPEGTLILERIKNFALQLHSPIMIVDHSYGLLSTAQVHISFIEEQAKRKVVEINAKKGIDLQNIKKMLKLDTFFILLNPNPHPIERGATSSFDDSNQILDFHGGREITVSGEKLYFSEAFKKIYGNAIERSCRYIYRPTKKDGSNFNRVSEVTPSTGLDGNTILRSN